MRSRRGIAVKSIAIFILLAASAFVVRIFVYNRINSENFREGRTLSQERLVKKASKNFWDACRRFPKDIDELLAVQPCEGQKQPLLNELPTDAWGRPLKIGTIPGGIRIFSLGADGLEGGSGESKDIFIDLLSTDERK